MKKTLLVISTLFLVSVLNAQNLSLGPTAGFGHAWLSPSEDIGGDNQFHASYNIGGKLVYSIVEHWGISADLKYSSEGGSRETTIAGDDYKYKYRANYVRIPFQGIYFFNELGRPVRPKISLGPSLGFFVGGDTELEVNDGEDSEAGDSKDIFKGFDFGLNAAVGANFRLGGGKWLNADITYYHGLVNVFEDAGELNVKNRNLGINVGVTFPIGAVRPE